MPGSITLKPIEAKLIHDTGLFGKMDPYVAFVVGENVFRSEICKKGGKTPQWHDSVTIPYENQKELIVEVMDKDRFTKDDNIGSVMINVNELQSNGPAGKWYPLFYKNKPAGEILLETAFTGIEGAFVESTTVAHDEIPLHERKIYEEKREIVEPHTFVKEVDVVETRPHLEQIEVMEPVKVTKEVQYTEAVPVTKTIEVTEPTVVKKEVEVIEPKLVTKTIQVIENVPVKKEVEVIENITTLKEVETMEPKTFTKEVEVTEYVPVQKEVTVTEPVHLKKAVEYVEDVVTTKTITKEIVEPIVVEESVTTHVGPASVIGESETYFARYSWFHELPENERVVRKAEYRRLRGLGRTDLEIEKDFETRGWNKHPKLTKEEKEFKAQEFDALRAEGLTKKEANMELEAEGLGKQHTIFGKKI